MILFLDFRNERQKVGLIGESKAEWRRHEGRRGEFELLAELAESLGLHRNPPSAVVAAVWPEGGDGVSWSSARTVVTVANALAFAWGVPAVGLDVGKISEDDLPEAIRKSVVGHVSGDRVHVTYSGDPNISKPKDVF